MAGGSGRTFFFGGIAALAVGATGFVVGARVVLSAGADLDPMMAAGIGAVVALALGLAPPLGIAARLIGALGPERVHRGAVRWTSVLLWNLGVVALMVGAFPSRTAEGLRSHGDWIPGTSGTPVEALSRAVADGIHPVAPGALEPLEPLEVEVEAPVSPGLEPAPVAAELVLPGLPMTASELFRQRADSVVVVKTRTEVDPTGPMAALFEMAGVTVKEGHGSGFVVDAEEGLVVTNHHVIAGAGEVALITRDGRRLAPVELLAADPDNDLALLRVGEGGLPAIPLATEVPEVGATTYAIGAPLGLDHSLTQGIVSAHRDLQGTAMLQMQTTVAPGSSGGPLLDERGLVVGVNTATRSPGLNLAVQVSYVSALLERERIPVAFGAWEAGIEVRSLKVEGVDLLPTQREAISGVLQAVGTRALSCVETLPPDARVLLEVPLEPGREGTSSGSLAPEELACLDKGLRLATLSLQMAGMELGGGMVVQAELARGEEVLVLELRLGTPSVAPSSDLER